MRWGILGTGNIARQFATGVAASTRGTLAAVGSRSRETAEAFARTHRIPAAHGRYEDLLLSRDVDAIYVSLPNSMHHEWTLAALRAGKHVLCEKPFAVTTAQAEEMFDAAANAGRVVMEGFMYRCHPQTAAVLEAVRGGAIGELKLIRTSFCFRTTKVADNIRFRPELAGGALMDVGCYCLSFSRLIAGAEPAFAEAAGRLHPSGVDELCAGVLRFPSDVTATFACGTTVQADNAAYVCGSDGYIEVPVPWKPPANGATYTVAHSTPPRMDARGPRELRDAPVAPPRRTYSVDSGAGDLYAMEADEFAASVLDARPTRISRQETLGNTRLLERLRKQIGLAY